MIKYVNWLLENSDESYDDYTSLGENDDFIHTKYGYCYYSLEDGKATIYNLFIEPEYRKKGLARKLLEMVIDVIRNEGVTEDIEISAEPRDKSIDLESLKRFYRSMDLKIVKNKE